MELSADGENADRKKIGYKEERLTVVIETTEQDIQRNISFHRQMVAPEELLIMDESLMTTNDLGADAMEMIARANSISDAKQQKLLGLRPESNYINRMKSTEVQSRESKNVDFTKSALRAGNSQFSLTDSMRTKDISNSFVSKAKIQPNLIWEIGGSSSF